MLITTQEQGLFEHEIKALRTIKDEFTKHDLLRKQGEWLGYAGFRFVDAKGKEGEFDLIILTHANIIVVELKDWNGKEIISQGGRWYMDGHDMGISPVDTTRRKQELLTRKLKKIAPKLTQNDGRIPFVKYFVVMCGKVGLDGITEREKKHVLTLSQFLKLAERNTFNKTFRPHPSSTTMYKDFPVIGKLFTENQIGPRQIIIHNYKKGEETYTHPKKLFIESDATDIHERDNKGVIRAWDFSKFSNMSMESKYKRFELLSHERKVANKLKQGRLLQNTLLTALVSPTEQSCTQQYNELIELPPRYMRLNQFISGTALGLSAEKRLDIIQIILSKFAEMHELGISHGNINATSLWLSQQNDIGISNLMTARLGDESNTFKEAQQEISLYDGRDHNEFVWDTYWLAYTLWHVWNATRVGLKRVKPAESLELTDHWFDQLLKSAFSFEIESIQQFLECFLKRRPKENGGKVNVLNNDILAEYYKRGLDYRFNPEPILVTDYSLAEIKSITDGRKEYSDDHYIIVQDAKRIRPIPKLNALKSSRWNNFFIGRLSSSEKLECKRFLDNAKKIQALNPNYLLEVVDFGIGYLENLNNEDDFLSPGDGDLFLIEKNVDHDPVVYLDKQDKLILIEKILMAMQDLADMNILAGHLSIFDVKLYNNEDGLNKNGEKGSKTDFILENVLTYRKKPAYNFTYIANSRDGIPLTPTQRHFYFAVYYVMEYLLGISLDSIKPDENNSAKHPNYKQSLNDSEFNVVGGELDDILKAVSFEIYHSDEPFTQLFSLIEAVRATKIKMGVINTTSEEIRVASHHVSEQLTILPDNGKLYIFIDKAQSSGEIYIRISGVGGVVSCIYSLDQEKVLMIFKPILQNEVSFNNIRNAVLTVDAKLVISPASWDETAGLTEFIDDHSKFKNAILNCAHKKEKAALYEDESDEESDEDLDTSKHIDGNIETKDLWRAILETETESLPAITLDSDLIAVEGEKKAYDVTYSNSESVLDNFRKSDLITALFKTTHNKTGEDLEFTVGEVNIAQSQPGIIRLMRVKNADKYTKGMTLYLRTKADKASYIKRKAALSKILDRKAQIPRLVEYFEPKTSIEPVEYPIDVSDADFDAYSQFDKESGELKVSLNQQQRDAFKKLLKYGPVSILQGPPGTGKTEFIAAFVHYLFNKQKVGNVLMVSQSHAAVNTAAERIRSHSKRHNDEIDVVRFSNKEEAVSDGLKDVFSDTLISTHRQLFNSNLTERMLSLSQVLAVPKDYIEIATYLYINVFSKLKSLRSNVFDEKVDAAEEKENKISLKEWEEIGQESFAKVIAFSEEVFQEFSHYSTTELFEAEKAVWDFTNECYEVTQEEHIRVKSLLNIADDFGDLINAPFSNYEKFLSQTKQFVCGTCVGIGHNSIGIADQVFDWVIIDEAARSISSELAIAMQSAKRILLVGDHKQLPPLYSKEHMDALKTKLGVDTNQIKLNLASDFERLFYSNYGDKVNGKLLVQYRMAPAIGQMVSECFYVEIDQETGLKKNGLEMGVVETFGDSNHEKLVREVPHIYQPSTVPELQSTVTWVDTSSEYSLGKGSSHYNPHEANKIIETLEKIQADTVLLNNLKDMAKPNEPPIGIICMYGEQKRHLISKFNSSKSFTNEFKKLVKIDSVDSYQGKENRIIMLSVTRYGPDNKIGFMNVPNRINVALSRAMDRLIIFGAANLWSKHSGISLGLTLSYIQQQRVSNPQLYRFIPDKKK